MNDEDIKFESVNKQMTCQCHRENLIIQATERFNEKKDMLSQMNDEQTNEITFFFRTIPFPTL